MARAAGPAITTAVLTPIQMQQGIERLKKRIQELERFDPIKVVDQYHHPEADAIKVAIQDSLTRTFGVNTHEYNRYSSAASLDFGPFYMGDGPSINEIRKSVSESKEQNLTLLAQAIRTLKEWLDEAEVHPVEPVRGSASTSRKVFVVHGHDEGARESVARFLSRIGFEPIVLHEQANRGRTIIEKVEAESDVSFAIVILTPDDQGCVRGGELQPRARQNVLLELGYFIGRLGRSHVLALRRGDLEIPTDFAGVLWSSMDDDGWKMSVGRELQAAGHVVDWNVLMR